MNRKDLQDLSRIRLSESKTLLSAGHPDGAYYLAGYSVECGLKACIAKGIQRHDFPDRRKVEKSHTHNLDELIKVANLEDSHLERAKRDRIFRNNWDLVQQWSEQSRYRRHQTKVATALVDAVATARHGVMAWIKQHW